MGPSDLGGRLIVLRDTLRTQLWLLPSVGVGLALGLGVGLPQLDARLGRDLPPWMTGYLFGGGASAARTVLGAIAGSLITVTSLTFSMTLVTLQLASSQFSPRLLRTFARDRFVQATLALFLATFIYALTVLRTIRSAGESREVFVPQIAVTTGFVLALVSVLALVLFLAHLARELRAETTLLRVHGEANETIRRVLPPRRFESVDVRPVSPPPEAVPLPAGASGFVLRMDESSLLSAAVEADVVLLIDCCPGSLLVAGTPMGAGWPRAATSFDADIELRLTRQVARAIRTGPERTAAHDVTYGLRQLIDVAVKALSPGINDPTTAVHALGHVSVLLCDLAGRQLGPRPLRDERGRVRVMLYQPNLADLLTMTLAQPLHYGAHDSAVLAQMFFLLRDLAWCATSDQRPAIAHQLEVLRAEAAGRQFGSREMARFDTLSKQVEQALAGRWAPAWTPS
ncbi:MAG: hypothetical protein K0R62_694 [Nonomuraea muscovyensis]|nr:hypothetical protein [Nonomuraea muscovyensis]